MLSIFLYCCFASCLCVALMWSFSVLPLFCAHVSYRDVSESHGWDEVSEHYLLFFVLLSTISVYILSLGPKSELTQFKDFHPLDP